MKKVYTKKDDEKAEQEKVKKINKGKDFMSRIMKKRRKKKKLSQQWK